MNIFKKFIDGLNKTRSSILKKISDIFKGELNGDFFEELEFVLVSADISISTASDIIEDVKKIVHEKKYNTKEQLIEVLRNVLASCLESAGKITIDKPAVIMMIGVNGVGKTTTIGKLANYYAKDGLSVVLAAADTFRAAAADQLAVWSNRANVRIIKQESGNDPSAVVFDAISSATAKKTDVLIIDTAGRLHNKTNLMEELKKMCRVVNREYGEANFYKLLVIDAVTGQNALSQVKYFDEAVGVDGIVLTKIDGTAKGGVVVTIAKEMNMPICFVGLGEGIDDLQEFDSKMFAAAII